MEIGRIEVLGHHGKKFCETPSQPIFKKQSMVAHICHPSYMGIVNKRMQSRPAWT
jgi:hypothetical protein